MIREMSPEALKYLTEREGGVRLDVHDDGYGYPTVGVGHLVVDADSLKIGDRITDKQAADFLQDDCLEARECVSAYAGGSFSLKQHQYDALCIFCFNIGTGAFRRSTLVKRLRENPLLADIIVEEEMPRWSRVRKEFSRGIYNRRIDTVQMFVNGDYAVDWSGLEGQK